MNKIDIILQNINNNIEVVDNLADLQFLVSDNDTKLYTIEKGIINYILTQYNQYKETKLEYLTSITKLSIALLTENENIKIKMIDIGIGDILSDMIQDVIFKDKELINVTLNQYFKLFWGLCSVINYDYRRRIVTKVNIKKVLSSFQRITSNTTASLGINIMAVISVDNSVIPYFISTGMIEECLKLSQQFKTSNDVIKSTCIFISNTLYSYNEYNIAKNYQIDQYLIQCLNSFKQDNDILSVVITAFRSLANCDEIIRNQLIDLTIPQQLMKIVENKPFDIQEKAIQLYLILSQSSKSIPILMNINILPFIISTSQSILNQQHIFTKENQSELSILQNCLGILFNICLEKDSIENVIKSDIIPSLHSIMKSTLCDKTCQILSCNIIQCLSITKDNCILIKDNDIINDILLSFQKYLKIKDICLTSIGACINLSQYSLCALELVEKGIFDILISLFYRYYNKQSICLKILICISNIIIDEQCARLSSQDIISFLLDVIKHCSYNQDVIITSLKCISLLIKSKALTNIIQTFEILLNILNMENIQINNALIELICTISSDRELAIIFTKETLFTTLISNGKQYIQHKILYMNTLACLINFSCYNELHKELLSNELFELLTKGIEMYKNDIQICSYIISCLKNLSIIEESRNLINNYNYHTLIYEIIMIHQHDEQLLKVCISCLWNLSLSTHTTFTSNEIYRAMIGLCKVLMEKKYGKEVKENCYEALNKLRISDGPIENKRKEMIEELKKH
ncbi:Armadillo repeat-containing protein 8 [Entamoeba marina]